MQQAGSAGRYDIAPASTGEGSRLALASFAHFGGCGVAVQAHANDGKVEVTHAEPVLAAPEGELTGIAGEFDLAFADGHLAGRFYARSCPYWCLVYTGCR